MLDAEPITVGEETAMGVDRQLSVERGVAFGDEGSAFTSLAEAQSFELK